MDQNLRIARRNRGMAIVYASERCKTRTHSVGDVLLDLIYFCAVDGIDFQAELEKARNTFHFEWSQETLKTLLEGQNDK